MDICLIWSQARNGAIGRQGRLPWHSPEDARRLMETTQGHPVIMGRRTWEARFSGVLPGRQHIVLSSGRMTPMGATHCSSLSEALTLASVLRTGRAYVVGGAQLYRQALKVADRLLVTHVDAEVEDADAFAPAIDASEFRLLERTVRSHVMGPALVYEEYVRRSRLA